MDPINENWWLLENLNILDVLKSAKNCLFHTVVIKKPEWYQIYLRDFDAKLNKSGRQFILLINNCTSHGTRDNLKSITICWFPPNVISKLQPVI